MATMNDMKLYSNPSLSMILEQQPQLYDLHTHLLGMGNAGFWIDSILLDTNIMPANNTFINNEAVRRDLPPLIWDQVDNTGFVNGDKATQFIDYLIKHAVLSSSDLQETTEKLKLAFPDHWRIFCKLIESEELKIKLHDKNLHFKWDFSYDVVLKLTDLGKGLGVKEDASKEFIQIALVEKLGIYLSNSPIHFRHWIIFDARQQKFDVVYGIQVEELRRLITIDPDKPSEAKNLARAHVINAFSMCDAQGTPARNVDLHNFHRAFTPEFYPRRFALKDSIYSQRLDVLAALLNHVLKRYQVCLPPVKYCEFSVGVSDLSSAWMFDVLRSFPVHQEKEIAQTINERRTGKTDYTYPITKESSSFSQCVLDNHFPYLKVACTASDKNSSIIPSTPNVIYKFLAGFNRQHVQSPFPVNQDDALRLLLNNSPRAIQLMLQEIVNSERQGNGKSHKQSQVFDRLISQLEILEEKGTKIPLFYHWVVGIDLFGDELGYPYCPFVARPFIDYIVKQRRTNSCFGMRIHCGENVPFADGDSAVYRLFVAHMYIVFRCLLFLQRHLKYGIRIGHGIAFERVLDTSITRPKHRKSSVLLGEIRHYAEHLFKTIAFEVNITSSEYLIPNSLRGGNSIKTHRLDRLIGLKAPIILATDDDGIWPIDRCSCAHPGHHSLTAEYCRAISSGIICSTNQLNSMFEASKNFCFFNMGGQMPEIENILSLDDERISTLLVHPDIIKLVLVKCIENNFTSGPFYKHYFKIYSNNYRTFEDGEDVGWNDKYKSLAQVAYVCFYTDCDQSSVIPEEYHNIFSDDQPGEKFRFISENWNRIRRAFMLPNDNINDLQQDRHMLLTKGNQSFYSTPSNANQDPSHLVGLVKYLNNNCYRKLEIHAFTGPIDIARTANTINERLNDTMGYEDISLLMYTNNDVKRYTYYQTGDLLERSETNSNPVRDNNPKENFFYVLCPHVRAATTALHIIAKMISAPVTAFAQRSTTIAVLQPQFDIDVDGTSEIAFDRIERPKTPPSQMVIEREHRTD